MHTNVCKSASRNLQDVIVRLSQLVGHSVALCAGAACPSLASVRHHSYCKNTAFILKLYHTCEHTISTIKQIILSSVGNFLSEFARVLTVISGALPPTG